MYSILHLIHFINTALRNSIINNNIKYDTHTRFVKFARKAIILSWDLEKNSHNSHLYFVI